MEFVPVKQKYISIFMYDIHFFWLKPFAQSTLSSYILQQPQKLFNEAKEGRGSQYLYSLGSQYALTHEKPQPPKKCFHLEYTCKFDGLEALFLNVYPCLYLSSPPVYLAAVRCTGSSFCRLFRLHYPVESHLYLSEIQLNEESFQLPDFPTYQEATALIFSYTLGTPFVPKSINYDLSLKER